MAKRILITGAGGFVGYHLVREFHHQASFGRDFRLLTPTSRQLNLLDFQATSDYLAEYKPTTILHCAAKCAGIMGNKATPAEFLFENTQMALNVYEAARLNEITNIYSLGSVCAYPKNCPVPFKEDNIWDGMPEPTNFPYSQGKRTLMLLEQTYREQYGFTGCHFIPANMFGPKDKFDLKLGHAIPALIQKFDAAIKNDEKVVKCIGSGEASREFLYSESCAELLVKAVLSDFDCPLPINVGTGVETRIKDLTHLIAELMGYKGDIAFLNDGQDGQPRRQLDITRAREKLGWEAKVELEDGLCRTISWYRENFSSDAHSHL